MLELDNGQLSTWRLPGFPLARLFEKSGNVIGDSLANHRLVYLDYEGPISGDRGSVRRILAGEYRAEIRAPTIEVGEFNESQATLPHSITNSNAELLVTLQGKLDGGVFKSVMQTRHDHSNALIYIEIL